ncbi:hypothetical protein ACLMJK_009687 [Lecanora helva]
MFARAWPCALRTIAPRAPVVRTIERQPFSSTIHSCSHPPKRRNRLISSPLYRRSCVRQQRNASTRQKAIKLFKENPFSVSLASAITLFGFGALIYTNYVYQTYIIGEFAAYPEPVAAKLRRALYYTNHDIQPKNAVKYYRQALELADELGMDPFSDEILGVKIQLSAMFEKIGMYQKAIEVLELVQRDCMRWLEELGGLERNRGKRTKVLGKTIGISVKLGEYYASDHIQNQDAAEEHLVWAVTELIREQVRREEDGVKEGEGDWMTNEEIGGALESLGHHWEAKNQHYFAAPLFAQALRVCPSSECHSVVLMNNLAISLAQQKYPNGFSPTQNSPLPSSASQVSSAREWALKALERAASIKPPDRTAECDEGCAVATVNLGDFALMEGDLDEARRRFEEGKSIAKAIGFAQGIVRADQGLRELKGKT